MKAQFFTLLVVAAAAFARPQGEESPEPTSDDNIETFPTVIPGTGTATFSFIPPDISTTPESEPSVSATVSPGNSTTAAAPSTVPVVTSPTVLPSSTSKAAASKTSSSTSSSATGAASSVRSASVPLVVVAGILGASQMFF